MFVLRIILLSIVCANTANAVQIDKHTDCIVPVDEVFIFRSTDSISNHELLKNEYQPHHKNGLNFGLYNGWYAFQFTLSASENQSLVFNIGNGRIDQITLYQLKKNVPDSLVLVGHKTYFNNDSRHFNFMVFHPAGQYDYYLKVNFIDEAYFPLSICKFEAFTRYENNRFLMLGLYYGISIMVLVINLFLYFNFRNSSYLAYSFLLFNIMLAFLSHDYLYVNLFRQLLWLKYYPLTVNWLLVISSTVFIRIFLDSDKHFPWLKYAFYICGSGGCIFHLLYILSGNYSYQAFGNLMILSLITLYWVTMILLIKKKPISLYTTIGFGPVILSTSMWVLHIMFGMDFFAIPLDVVRFTSVFEMLVLTYAIVIEMRKVNKQNSVMKKQIADYMQNIDFMRTENKRLVAEQQKVIGFKSQIDLDLLSHRENEILRLLIENKTNRQISEELHISVNTVKYHVKNIYEKLKIKSRLELIKKVSL